MTRFSFFALLIFTGLVQAATPTKPFSIWIQNLYSVQITQDKLNIIVAPMEEVIGQPIEVRSTSEIKDLERAMEVEAADMIFWGGYKAVEELTKKHGFSQLAKAQIDVIIYQYRPLHSVIRKDSNIAVLKYSSAWQVMKHHLPDNARVHYFDDYYGIIKHLDSHHIDFVVATPTFLIPVPETVKKKFNENHRLKSFGYAAQWIKAAPRSKPFERVKRFLRSKDKEFEQYFGVRFYPATAQ